MAMFNQTNYISDVSMYKYSMLNRARLVYDYLITNATTYVFPFSAMAELLDNSKDANAKSVHVYTTAVDPSEYFCGFLLSVLDDGDGMSPNESANVMSYGTSNKKNQSNKIGQYGNGLKSSIMRLGMDFIVITKQKSIVTIILVSRTFQEKEQIFDSIIYLMPSFHERTWEPYFLDDSKDRDKSLNKHQMEFELIFKYSPYKTKNELIREYAKIQGESGTIVTIYNMMCTPADGKPELDITTCKDDILSEYNNLELPIERRSFRAYCAIIYSEPKMKIYIQNVKVRTTYLEYTLLEPRFYVYETKKIFLTRAKKDLDLAIDQKAKAYQKYRDAVTVQVNQHRKYGDTRDKTILRELHKNEQRVIETRQDMDEKEQIYETKKKHLSDPITLTFKFGINLNNRAQSGLFIYNCHRLIVMHEKPKYILNNPDQYSGIIGFVDVPYEVLEPAHNKQSFESSPEYTKLAKALVDHMNHYVIEIQKEVRKEMKDLWKYYGYDGDSNEPSLDFQSKKLRFFKTPLVLQCDKCLKWRQIPVCTTDVGNGLENFADTWSCQDLKIADGRCCSHSQKLREIGYFNYVKQTTSKDASSSQVNLPSIRPIETHQDSNKKVSSIQINNDRISSQRNYDSLAQISANRAGVSQRAAPLVNMKVEFDVDPNTHTQNSDVDEFVRDLQDRINQHQQPINNNINRIEDNQGNLSNRHSNKKTKYKDHKQKTRTRIIGLSSSDSDDDYRPPHSAKKQKVLDKSHDDVYRNRPLKRPDMSRRLIPLDETNCNQDKRRIEELGKMLNANKEMLDVFASHIRLLLNELSTDEKTYDSLSKQELKNFDVKQYIIKYKTSRNKH